MKNITNEWINAIAIEANNSTASHSNSIQKDTILFDRVITSTLSDSENEESLLTSETSIQVENAGLVLVSPFLPRLFSMLGLTINGQFVDMVAAERAVHLLQFIVAGQKHTSGDDLTLNKILCGINTSVPISNGINITAEEQSIIESMLQGVIQHWRAIAPTSAAGLRGAFLQRQGFLVSDIDGWRIKVQERSYDMLIDRLPWGISHIKYPWMDKLLRISWRNY